MFSNLNEGELMSVSRIALSLFAVSAVVLTTSRCASTPDAGDPARSTAGELTAQVPVPPIVRRKVKPVRQTLHVLYHGNRGGVIEPCGCHSSPYGGLDREANALKALKKGKGEFLSVDAGNLFASPTAKVGKDVALSKGETVAGMLATNGLEAYAPGPMDYALGYEWLQKIQGTVPFKFISTNVQKVAGKPAFEPFVVVKKGKISVGIVSVTPPDAPELKAAGMIGVDINSALNEVLPKVREQADIVVVLSQLGNYRDQELIRSRGDLDIVVGLDPEMQTENAYWFPPSTILVDGYHNGYMLGHLKVDVQLPLTGFVNDKALKENKERLAGLEQAAQANADEKSKKRLADFKKYNLIEKVAGASQYENEIIRLDEKRYGKANAMTKRIDKYRAEVREKAIAQ